MEVLNPEVKNTDFKYLNQMSEDLIREIMSFVYHDVKYIYLSNKYTWFVNNHLQDENKHQSSVEQMIFNYGVDYLQVINIVNKLKSFDWVDAVETKSSVSKKNPPILLCKQKNEIKSVDDPAKLEISNWFSITQKKIKYLDSEGNMYIRKYPVHNWKPNIGIYAFAAHITNLLIKIDKWYYSNNFDPSNKNHNQCLSNVIDLYNLLINCDRKIKMFPVGDLLDEWSDEEFDEDFEDEFDEDFGY